MEYQTQAMRSMFAVLRAHARASITTGREGTPRFVSLKHQKQTGNSRRILNRSGSELREDVRAGAERSDGQGP